MFFTPAYAQAAGAPAGAGMLETVLPLIAIFVIMYFLVIRPQQKRMREHREMVEAVRRGDEIVTQGGIFAKVTKVKEDADEVEAEIAPNIKVRLVKSTITTVMSKADPAPAKK